MSDRVITLMEYTLYPKKSQKFAQTEEKADWVIILDHSIRLDTKHKKFSRTAFLWNTSKQMLVKCFHTFPANIREEVARRCFMKTLRNIS